MARKSRTVTGFTLIELMIAVTIVGILAAIAIPSYSSYAKRSNRLDAINTMQQDAQALQRCYSQNFTYANGPTTPCTAVAGTNTSPGGYYNVTIAITPPALYTITAVPAKAPQTQDTPCQTFQMLSTGQHTAQNGGGTDTTTTCWGSN